MILAIKDGRVITMAGPVLERATVLIENGKIKSVGHATGIPEGAQVIDAAGRVVMPGIMDAHTHIGVHEDGLGWEGADGNECTDPATPQVRALDGINPEDMAFEDVRAAGITACTSAPGSGNVLGGEGVVIKTFGKTADQMFVRVWGMKAAFGENPKRVYREQKKMPTTRMGTAAVLRENLVKAQNYLKKLEAGEKDPDKLPERDLKMEALVRVLRREHPLRAHAHRADDIVTAIRIAEEFGIKVSIEHCTEGHKIAGYLAEKGVPCVVGPSMTGREKVELQNLTFETAGILARAGVKIALTTDHPVIPLQYLPICAGLAIRSGLDEEDALRAITINAAEIMGVSDRMGSIEPGKDADVIVLSGSPFELMTTVQYTLINGKVVYEAK